MPVRGMICPINSVLVDADLALVDSGEEDEDDVYDVSRSLAFSDSFRKRGFCLAPA